MSFVFDLNTNNYINIDVGEISGIIQMDDGLVILYIRNPNKLLLIDIKEKELQILQEIKQKFCFELSKLSPKKIIFCEGDRNKLNIYKYENKNLKKEKEINLEKKFKSIYYINNVVNEKEIVFSYEQNSLFGDSGAIGFYDLEKDNKIQYYKINGANVVSCVINKDLFIYAEDNILYQINLKNHKRKEFELPNSYNYEISSIISLNENKFLVAQSYY